MVVIYKCPGCGAPMVFDPESQKLTCEHCQTELTVEEYEQKYGEPLFRDEPEKEEAPYRGPVETEEEGERFTFEGGPEMEVKKYHCRRGHRRLDLQLLREPCPCGGTDHGEAAFQGDSLSDHQAAGGGTVPGMDEKGAVHAGGLSEKKRYRQGHGALRALLAGGLQGQRKASRPLHQDQGQPPGRYGIYLHRPFRRAPGRGRGICENPSGRLGENGRRDYGPSGAL